MAADSAGHAGQHMQRSSNDDLYSLGGSSMSFCHRLRGLSAGQTRMCQLYEDHMKSVGRGIRLAVDECQWLFSNRRWNCTTSIHSGNTSTTLFGNVIPTGEVIRFSTSGHRMINIAVHGSTTLLGPVSDSGLH